MLKGQFDFIIGNPPWLSYRYISDPEYQDEIKRRAVERYKIAPKSQKLFTQMELATVFLAHSMAMFANVNGQARVCHAEGRVECGPTSKPDSEEVFF